MLCFIYNAPQRGLTVGYFLHNTKQITKKFFGDKENIDKQKQEEYIRALVYIAQGQMFHTVAKNGISYFYFLPNIKSNIETAEYIFAKNGIYPLRHDSDLYYGTRIVLRVPNVFLLFDKHAGDFVNSLIFEKWLVEHKQVSLKKCRKAFEKVEQEANQNIK